MIDFEMYKTVLTLSVLHATWTQTYNNFHARLRYCCRIDRCSDATTKSLQSSASLLLEIPCRGSQCESPPGANRAIHATWRTPTTRAACQQTRARFLGQVSRSFLGFCFGSFLRQIFRVDSNESLRHANGGIPILDHGTQVLVRRQLVAGHQTEGPACGRYSKELGAISQS